MSLCTLQRKSVVEWGAELGLGGFSKPGFPGVVLVEVSLISTLLLPAGDVCW
jgi:hypothetical protein